MDPSEKARLGGLARVTKAMRKETQRLAALAKARQNSSASQSSTVHLLAAQSSTAQSSAATSTTAAGASTQMEVDASLPAEQVPSGMSNAEEHTAEDVVSLEASTVDLYVDALSTLDNNDITVDVEVS